MLKNVHWFGHDSFLIDGSVAIYIDPWKLPAGLPAAGVILVTHDHFDHLSLPDIQALSGSESVVVGPASVTSQVSGVATVTLQPEETKRVSGVAITGVAAYNLDKYKAPGELYHPRDAGGLGYVFALDGVRYYHAGDTDGVPEMADVQCDVALIPVSGTYVMTAEEAAKACETIQAAVVMPMHWGDIVGGIGDAERFRELCDVPVTILEAERA